MPVHPAVEGRHHPGVAEIDPGKLQAGLGLDDVRLGRITLGPPLLDLRLGGGVLFQEGNLPVVFLAGAQQLGLGRCQLAIGLLHLGLVHILLDEEEQVALFHVVPVLEMDAGQKTLDPRVQLNLVHGLGVAGQIQVVGHRLLRRPAHRDRGWRRRDELVFLLVATGRGNQRRDQYRHCRRKPE
jgi:hypothetical protein